MKFYGRLTEIQALQKTWGQIKQKARMITITGRRRVGKTLLSIVYVEDKPHLYLFVAKKAENLLCQEYVKQIKQTFEVPIIGEITRFKDVFALLLEIGKKQPFVLVIDEFQEFLNINPSVFSEIQELWDLNVFKTKIQLVLMGSVYSLMYKIFEDSKEPLFGRADRIVHLKPFSVSLLHQILKDNAHPELDLLFHYFFVSGGTPKYVDLLLTNEAFSEKQIFDFILSENSPFLDEGKNVLIEEFGKKYGMYFSILELIAVGKTSRGEIESILQRDIGGYLNRLENYYWIIKKIKPIHAKPNTKAVKYQIKDLFLSFWFRFIYRHRTAIETGNFDYVKRILEQSLSTYQGNVLERFFFELFAESHQFNRLGSYWERDHTNEIDLVGINDLDKRIVITEIKVNKQKISMEKLKLKAQRLLHHFPGYIPEYLALSLEDAKNYLYRP